MNISFLTEYEEYFGINPTFNDYVTEFCHSQHIRITKSQRSFLKKAYDINVLKLELWSSKDFKPISEQYVRKHIEKLSPIIEKVINSRPCYYKLKGIHMPDFVTKNPRGLDPRQVDPEFDRILADLKSQPPMMHDIRVGAKISKLSENLIKNCLLFPNPQNGCITLDIPIESSRFNIKANVYRESIQVMIGCTYLPLPYDLNGFHELSALLGKVCYHLEALGKAEFYYPPIPEWKIQYLHINKDGKEINGSRFSYSICDLSNHSVFYLKKFKDGTLRHRHETHETPNKTIEDMAKTLLQDCN